MDPLVIWTYVLGSIVVVAFGTLAAYVAWDRQVRQGKKDTVEFFLTARDTFGTFRIAWSFYAAAMGSWALFSPPSYGLLAGWIGIMMYSISSGLPILIQGFLGTIVRELPNVMSFSGYVLHAHGHTSDAFGKTESVCAILDIVPNLFERFGRLMQLWISALMLFNMGIAMTAEYTAVGSLFTDVIGTTQVPIVIIIGVVSSLYTAYGGLYASIITDQWQAGTSLVVLLVLIIYTAINFREPLPHPQPYIEIDGVTKLDLGANYNGYSAILVMPISLISSSIFSEAVWQRCLASQTNRVLRIGALFGALQIIAVVFLFAFGGYLAAWSGLWTPSNVDDYGNTVLFNLLDAGGRKVWVVTLVAILSTTLSESAIDSLQNAIVDNISGVFLQNVPIIWTRLLVVLLNIPVIIVSLQGYGIINLFLLANLVTTCATPPVVLGLSSNPLLRRYLTGPVALFGSWVGFASLCVWARIQQSRLSLDSYSAAMHAVFFEAYDWPPFLIAPLACMGGMLLGALFEELVVHRALGFEPAPKEPSAVRAPTLPPADSDSAFQIDSAPEKV